MTSSNKRLLAHLRSIREKIRAAVRELEKVGVGTQDVPEENFNAVAEAIGLLERMNNLYELGETMPDEVAVTMIGELDKTHLIARHHIGRMIAHVARTRGEAAVMGVRCPCQSGDAFPECCGSGTSPAP